MRLIHPARPRRFSGRAAMAMMMLIVGSAALALMMLGRAGHIAPTALLALSAALGLGVGSTMGVRAFLDGRRRTEEQGHDLARLLAPVFDHQYLLILSPRLPGVPDDLAALLVGPPGVRAVVARRWHGRYRVHGRGWEFDTGSRAGWMPCLTNPSFDADAATAAVARWAREAGVEPALPIAPLVIFPRGYSKIVLEEPEGEVVTIDNAPWWAQRIGRVQRMDAPRLARFVDAVLLAAERPAESHVGAATVRTA